MNVKRENLNSLSKQLTLTYLQVVDESNVNALPDLASKKPLIVKSEWFWTSVQNEGAADEKEYLFEDVSLYIEICCFTSQVNMKITYFLAFGVYSIADIYNATR